MDLCVRQNGKAGHEIFETELVEVATPRTLREIVPESQSRSIDLGSDLGRGPGDERGVKLESLTPGGFESGGSGSTPFITGPVPMVLAGFAESLFLEPGQACHTYYH